MGGRVIERGGGGLIYELKRYRQNEDDFLLEVGPVELLGVSPCM